jgi:hypothetical protein
MVQQFAEKYEYLLLPRERRERARLYREPLLLCTIADAGYHAWQRPRNAAILSNCSRYGTNFATKRFLKAHARPTYARNKPYQKLSVPSCVAGKLVAER